MSRPRTIHHHVHSIRDPADRMRVTYCREVLLTALFYGWSLTLKL